MHVHLLPGLDDGPSTLAESVDLARSMTDAGIDAAVATPHIRDDYPFPAEAIAVKARELRTALHDVGIPLTVYEGGEVSIPMAVELSDGDLARVAYPNTRYVLVESPYTEATDFLESAIFDLQARGFWPILAHPERSPSFISAPDRLATLVERGALTSITAASMAGRFGRRVQHAAADFLVRGLVHNVATDAHDCGRRPPHLGEGFDVLGPSIPGLRDAMSWFTREVPIRILRNEPVPERPALDRRRRFRRLGGARAAARRR